MWIKPNRNDNCWCGSGLKYKKCHQEFDDKLLSLEQDGFLIPPQEIIKTAEQIERIKKSSQINIAALDYVEAHMKEGITTEQIDQWVYQVTTERGGIPATLGYEGYPKSVCTSINDQVCHGIPSEHIILKDGDIVNVDCSTILDGYFSDSSRMFCIGQVSEEKASLVRVVRECVELGLEQVKPWGFLGDVAQVINDHAQKHGYSVVREVGGHGIGLEFHEEPWVGYVAEKGTGMVMAPGMIFTIEPMVNIGSHEIYLDQDDGWGIYTTDGTPSAQWEIMVLVTEDGHEVLAY